MGVIKSLTPLPVRLEDNGDGSFTPYVRVEGGGTGGGSTGGLTNTELRATPVDVNPVVSKGIGSSDANTQRVTLATDGPVMTAIGTTTTASAPADGTGDYSLLAAAKRSLLNWTSLLARIPALVSGRIPVEALGASATIITGPSALAAQNVDLLTGQSGTGGWFDAAAFQSGTIQIIASAGITAGAIFFEQTNDPVNAAAGVPLRAVESGTITANPNIAAITIAANSIRVFKVQIDARYIRVRISTAFLGGSVQAIANLSQLATAYPVVNVQQATAANLQTTATLAAGTAAVGQVSNGGIATSTGALTPARITSAASGSAKATAGRFYSWSLANTQAAIRYLQIFNKATAPVLGTDTPLITIPLAANSSLSDGSPIGWALSSGVAWAITTDVAGATAAAVGDVVGTFSYV